MRICPTDGLTATVTRDRRLWLYAREAGGWHHFPPPAAAWWIALQQNRGRPELAALALADAWRTDPAPVYARLARWINQLTAVGLTAITGNGDRPGDQ